MAKIFFILFTLFMLVFIQGCDVIQSESNVMETCLFTHEINPEIGYGPIAVTEYAYDISDVSLDYYIEHLSDSISALNTTGVHNAIFMIVLKSKSNVIDTISTPPDVGYLGEFNNSDDNNDYLYIRNIIDNNHFNGNLIHDFIVDHKRNILTVAFIHSTATFERDSIGHCVIQ